MRSLWASTGALALVLCCVVPVSFEASAQTATLPSATTNQIFPIDLPAALRLANAQNLDIQLANARLKEARANQESARELFFPWLAPGIAYRRHENRIQDVGGAMLDTDKQSYAPGAVFEARIDAGDAIYKTLASKQMVAAAGSGLQSQRQDTTLLAAQSYFDLLKAGALMGTLEQAVSISQDYQRQLHEAVGAGIAFKGDELRVQVQTERYQLAARQALEEQRVAAARLAQVLHLDPALQLTAKEADLVPLTLIETNTSLQFLIQQALNSRPELQQGKALVAAASQAKSGALYGPLIPSVGAQAFLGGLGGGKIGSPDTFGESEDYFVGLNWRIGPGGLFDFGRIHASKAQWEQARLGLEKARDEIARQVVEGLARADSLRDQLGKVKTNLTTASETLRLTRERKQFGIGVVLEDIQAQQDLTRARSDYVALIAEYNKAQYALSRAIGAPTSRY